MYSLYNMNDIELSLYIHQKKLPHPRPLGLLKTYQYVG